MALTAAARAQMAEIDARRTDAMRADLEADTADKLDDLRLFDQCFTTWHRQGQTIGRYGLTVGFDIDARTVSLLELTPDIEPCAACGRTGRRVDTRMITVPYADIAEVHQTRDPAARDGWGLRLIGAVQDSKTVSSDRSRRLLGWVDQLGKASR